MNLSIETLVTVMIAVLVAGIVGIAVFGESTDFIDWSDEESERANCGLSQTQAQNACPDEQEVESIQTEYEDQCDWANPNEDWTSASDFCS